MIRRLLSNDLPRSRWLAALLVVLFLGLALAPFLFPGVKALNVAAKILVFVALVASFDLLLGYTGIVSFAHTMFFGIGAYGVAIAMSSAEEPTWGALGLGVAAAMLVSLLLSLLIGLFSLRVRAIFFAMITLAVASAFLTLASQLSDFTGGEDGLSFSVPEWLSPSFELAEDPVVTPLGEVYGRQADQLLPALCRRDAIFLTILRIVNSPFGRVLQAIRKAISGPRRWATARSSTAPCPTCCPALFATLAGCLLALWIRYNGF
ncbi:MAG: branched-chain amino acid ABC transporter permease [Burkholderiaceae bacterium]